MSAGGWVTMIASLGAVWGLAIWCYRKVLTSPKEERVPPGYGP